jgi:hypothetical protein
MISNFFKTTALAAVFVMSGAAAYAQSTAPDGATAPTDQRGPVATDPTENGPPSANPTDRDGGGPAIRRSQERGEAPTQRPRNRMNDE